MKTSKGATIVIGALFLLFVGAFAAHGETYIPQKAIGAGANWGNGKVYFFKGSEYIRYDIQMDKADIDYPKKIESPAWPGLKWK